MTESILPKQYAEREHVLEAALGERLNSIQSPVLTLWNADACSLQHLPHLAASLSVDFWDESWSEDTKREMVKVTPELHRIKGTPAGVVKALIILSYVFSYIREHISWKHDGVFKRDGSIKYGQPLKWYEFDVYLQSGESPNAEMLASLQTYIQSFKATHSRLRRIYYGTRKHNGQHKRDGSIKFDGGLAYG